MRVLQWFSFGFSLRYRGLYLGFSFLEYIPEELDWIWARLVVTKQPRGWSWTLRRKWWKDP